MSSTYPHDAGQKDAQESQRAMVELMLSLPNPYGFPFFLLNPGVKVSDVPVWLYPVSDDPVTHVKKIQSLPMREDDIFIAAYMKCGTHWVSEILHMLVRGSPTYAERSKESEMVELNDDLDSLAQLPSPRILNSHNYIAQLPCEILEKRVKLIHLLRHPKDCAISWYYHIAEMAPLGTFTMDNFLKGYIDDDHLALSHQFNYLRQMAEFEKQHPDHPIIHIHYEDLHKDPISVVQELAKFVGVKASETFCKQVVEACQFDKLKEFDQGRKLPENVQDKITKKAFYRKGVVGDWRNQLTVAQNEMMDSFIATQERKGYGYTLKGQ